MAVKKKQIKRINGNWLCESCYKKRLKDKRDKIEKEVLGITEEQKLEEQRLIKNKYEKENREKNREKINKYQREYKKKHKKIKIIKPIKEKPIIKGAKIKKRYFNTGLCLNKIEKQLLFKKYLSLGYSYSESDKKVKEINDYLKNLKDRLKKESKSEEEFNNKFKEEFAKLLESQR